MRSTISLFIIVIFNILYSNIEFIPREINFGDQGILSIHSLDIDKDGLDDLLYSSIESNSIYWLKNKGDNSFTSKQVLNDLNGPKSIFPIDFNLDGKIDILAGNAGSNFKWIPDKEKPVKIYLDDYDENLQLDPIIFYDFFGAYVPFASKDKLDKQLPYLKKKFPKYINFSKVNDI